MRTLRGRLLALATLLAAAIPTSSDSAPRRNSRREIVPGVRSAGQGPSLGWPVGIAVDATGTVAITDLGMNAVVSVDPATGNRTLLSDVAHGTGPALSVLFPDESRNVLPTAIDATGARLVVDHDRVLRVDPDTGNRTFVSSANDAVGSGPRFSGPRGIAVDSGGAILVTASTYGGVVRVDPATGDRTLLSGCPFQASSCVPAGSGPTLVRPAGAVLGENGALFVANGEAVLRVDPVSGDRTVALDGTTGSGPVLPPAVALAREASGDFLWASRTALFRIDGASGDRVLLSGDQAGGGTPFRRIEAMALEANGAVVVADADLGAVVRVNATTGERTILAGGPVGGGPRLTGCALGAAREVSGTIVIANCEDGLVRVDPATGDRSLVSGPGTGSGPALTQVQDVAVEAAGTLLAVDHSSLKRVDPHTGARTVVADASTGAPFLDARGVALEPEGTALVMDSGLTVVIPIAFGIPVQTYGALRRVDVRTGSSEVVSGGGLLGGGVGRGPRFSQRVTSIAHDPKGVLAFLLLNNLLEVDLATGDRRFVNRAHLRAEFSPTPLETPTDVAVAADGSWVIPERRLSRVSRVDPFTGAVSTLSGRTVGSGPLLGSPRVVVVEPGGTLLVVFAVEVTASHPEPVVVLVRIDPATGDRTVLSRY